MQRALLAVMIGSLTGCAPPPDETGAGARLLLESAASASPLTSWSRSASGAASGAAEESIDAGQGPVSADVVEPSALAELLAAVPKDRPSPTGEDGGTAIGTATGGRSAKEAKEDAKGPPEAKGTAAPSPPAEAPPKKPLVSIGAMSIQAEMSSPSIERTARAQLYWPLVQRCRDKEGKVLPPDAILILFRIDEAGYIIASSIGATPSKPAFEDAAHCMRRELSAATFRAPAGGRGMLTNVTMTVPSVD